MESKAIRLVFPEDFRNSSFNDIRDFGGALLGAQTSALQTGRHGAIPSALAFSTPHLNGNYLN